MNGQIIATPEISYCSLALCILSNMTIEQSFQKIAPLPRGRKDEIKDETIIKLRGEGKTWDEISEILGITKGCAFCRVKRFERRNQQ